MAQRKPRFTAAARYGGDYWIETITELRGGLISSSKLDDGLVDKFLTYCADSNWWTQTIAFTAVHGRTIGG